MISNDFQLSVLELLQGISEQEMDQRDAVGRQPDYESYQLDEEKELLIFS